MNVDSTSRRDVESIFIQRCFSVMRSLAYETLKAENRPSILLQFHISRMSLNFIFTDNFKCYILYKWDSEERQLQKMSLIHAVTSK